MRIILALAASAAIASSAQAVTIVNGSFEQGAAISGNSIYLNTGDTTSLPGWTVLTAGVDYVRDSLWDASAGSRSVELSGVSSGGVSQRINGFTVGQRYRVHFSLSANPFAADGLYRTTVSVSGGTAETFNYTKTAANLPTNMLYERNFYDFTASTASQLIQFRSQGTGALGSVLDNVSIGLVPEPSTWMMLIAGFGMTGFAMRRRAASVAA